jgi:hypothetical protein
MLEAPFEIGDVYWIAVSMPQSEEVTCPMCCGNKFVTLVLGTNEAVDIECEACSLGYIGSRGFIDQYKQEPSTKRFEIASVEEWRDGEWTVRSPGGMRMSFDRLYQTEAQALAVAEQNAKNLEDKNMESLRLKKYGRASSWKILYHEKQIRDYEQKIKWHRDHISTKKAKEA